MDVLSGCYRSFARKLIGWSMTLSPDSKLTGKALLIAYESRGKPKGVIFLSDSNNVLARFHRALTRNIGSCMKDGTNNVLSLLTHIAIDLMYTALALSIAYYRYLVRVVSPIFLTQEGHNACLITVLSKYLVVWPSI